MSDGEVSSGISSEPVIAPLPTPISVEPRTVPAGEAAELARQAEETKLPKGADPKKEASAATKTDEKAKPLSTRDALRAAAAKVNAEPAAEKASPLKADPKTAEPAAKAAEPAKSEPTKAAEPAKTEPVRAPDGKFAADPAKAAAAEPTAKVTEPALAKAAEPVKPSFTAEPPPSRFAAEEKAEWDVTPEKVRAGVLRMEKEYKAGFEKYKTAAERDSSLAEFHEMAAKGGTDVKTALGNYVNMENAIRNPETRDKGLQTLFANIGISPQEWAAKILGQAPDVAASQQDATIRELNAKIARLEQGLGSIQQERTQQKTDSTTEAVTKFAADHPRFEELSEDIAFFLKTRTKDLAEAYNLAERLNPAPAKAAEPDPAPIAAAASSAAPVVTLVPPVTPVAASTAGQKSIAGAPTAGSDPVRKQPSSSIKEALRRAQQRAG